MAQGNTVTRDPLTEPRFGDVFHWPGDPPDEFAVYLGPDPKTNGWIILVVNKNNERFGIPNGTVEDNIADDGWQFVESLG